MKIKNSEIEKEIEKGFKDYEEKIIFPTEKDIEEIISSSIFKNIVTRSPHNGLLP